PAPAPRAQPQAEVILLDSDSENSDVVEVGHVNNGAALQHQPQETREQAWENRLKARREKAFLQKVGMSHEKLKRIVSYLVGATCENRASGRDPTSSASAAENAGNKKCFTLFGGETQSMNEIEIGEKVAKLSEIEILGGGRNVGPDVARERLAKFRSDFVGQLGFAPQEVERQKGNLVALLHHGADSYRALLENAGKKTEANTNHYEFRNFLSLPLASEAGNDAGQDSKVNQLSTTADVAPRVHAIFEQLMIAFDDT
ncbi:unnamed protein product, partial [Amoebophrya sp. A120]